MYVYIYDMTINVYKILRVVASQVQFILIWEALTSVMGAACPCSQYITINTLKQYDCIILCTILTSVCTKI